MKFGDIIKSVNKDELKPETLNQLGQRYYEKYDNFFQDYRIIISTLQMS